MKFNFFLIITLSLGIFASALSAQDNVKIPLEKKQNPAIKKKVFFTKTGRENAGFEGTPPDIGVLVEYISMDSRMANELLGKFAAKATDVSELRDLLEQLIDKGNAELVETIWVRSANGQRATLESVRWDTYPTRYKHPALSHSGGTSNSNAKNERTDAINPEIHMTAAMPATFDMRNVGTTIEIDPTLSSGQKIISLNLVSEIVSRLEDQYFTRTGFEQSAWGVENILMPNFYTMKDTTQIEVAPGKCNLLGIHTPPGDNGKQILVLLRADLIPFD